LSDTRARDKAERERQGHRRLGEEEEEEEEETKFCYNAMLMLSPNPCRPHPSWARNGPSSFSLGLEARWACAHVVVPAAGVTKVRSCLFNNVAYTVLFSIDSRAGSEWFYSI
jgi:hypothetical protein